jgi:hypothetical protein
VTAHTSPPATVATAATSATATAAPAAEEEATQTGMFMMQVLLLNVLALPVQKYEY